MKKEINNRIDELEIKTGIQETGVKVLSPDEYNKLKKQNKISDKVHYIIDNIGIIENKDEK